jgi:hypothetical protein
MTAAKKDKEKVLDEVWTEERVKSFLNLSAPVHVNEDFHVLYSAYKSMRLDNFAEFLVFFKDAGRDFSAKNEAGETVADIVANHKKSAGFLVELKKYM